MLTSPPAVQKQLSAAIAQIGQEDFPNKWPNLINDMVTRFQQTGDFNMINGVLQTAFSIFENPGGAARAVPPFPKAILARFWMLQT